MNHVCAALLSAVAAVATGCSVDHGNATESAILTATTTSAAADSLPSFDSCTALDGNFRRAHDLDGIDPRPFTDAVADYRWRGCTYQTEDYVGIQVGVTNSTVEDAVSKNYAGTTELEIGNRRAVHFRVKPEWPKHCTLFVAITGGSLYLEADVPDSGSAADLDACQTAVDVATVVEPLLPN